MVTEATEAKTHKHINDERTVVCPVEGCDETPLARGVHLHVMRSDGNGHGPQGDVPPHITFDNLETAGSRQVSMNYPEHRETEHVARLCPYCERPFRGKHGVMIHLGQTAGRKNHPENPRELHDPDDFAVVHVDDNENVVEVVEDGAVLPSATKRDDIDEHQREVVEGAIEAMRDRGMGDKAEMFEDLLLAD